MTDTFKYWGCSITPVLAERDALRLAEIVRVESLFCVFAKEWDKIEALSKAGIDPTQLLVDSKLREQHLQNPKSVWRHNNSRKPIVSKSCGMVNIYHQPQIRDHVLFNTKVVEGIRAMYKTLPQATQDEKIVYMNGPDRVGVKPKGSTDMERHLDSNLFLPCINQHPRYRVQALVTLQVGAPEGKITVRDLGSIEVLAGFHHYYELAGWFFSRLPGVTPFTGPPPYPIEKFLNTYLDTFLTWVKTYIYGPEVKPPELKSFIDKLPDKYVEVQWHAPITKPGDLLCFDTRLPHRNTRNKSAVTRIVAYVSLYRQEDHLRCISQGDKDDIEAKFTGKDKITHGGSNRDNIEERTVFAPTWEQRIKLPQLTPIIAEVLNKNTS